MDTTRKKAGNGVESVPAVVRAFGILEHLASDEPANPTQIARALGMPRTGVLRILITLADLGYLWRDPDTGNFSLTARLFAVGSKAPALHIRQVARPALERLRDESGETAELVVRDGHELLIVDAVDSEQSIHLHARPGRRFPLFRMATGRVLLSGMPEAEVKRLYREKTLDQFPLPPSFEALAAKLAEIRSQAYATDEGHAREDVERVACPVYGPDGLVAAIGIAGPEFRLKPTEETVQCVKSVARDLSLALGCATWPAATLNPDT